jgi:DNA-binding transcriptional LysR family regulator
MQRENLNDLITFIAVAREQSFTKAAAKLGVSQSALSYTIRQLEARLGIRLLTRTTRSVSPTDAGERLLQEIAPHIEEIQAKLEGLSELRDRPAGTVRLTASDSAIDCVLWPKLKEILVRYPDIKVELVLDNGLVDIVSQRLDAGVRMGYSIDKDMIAVRIAPDIRFAVVGSPSYFAEHPVPRTPQDLTKQKCINMRLPTYGGLWAWEFEKDGREVRVRVDGQVTTNGTRQVVEAALAGYGLAYIPEDEVKPHIAKGGLKRVLESWCPRWTGYHLYYPSRRQPSPAFAIIVEALRHRS